MRKYLERQPNREATTGQLEADLWRSRHKIGTHRRHLMRDGELVAGRLLHTADGGLFVPPRRGRERWNHLLSKEERHALPFQDVRRELQDMWFVFRMADPDLRKHRIVEDERALVDDKIPWAADDEDSWGEYEQRVRRQLAGLRVLVIRNLVNGNEEHWLSLK